MLLFTFSFICSLPFPNPVRTTYLHAWINKFALLRDLQPPFFRQTLDNLVRTGHPIPPRRIATPLFGQTAGNLARSARLAGGTLANHLQCDISELGINIICSVRRRFFASIRFLLLCDRKVLGRSVVVVVSLFGFLLLCWTYTRRLCILFVAIQIVVVIIIIKSSGRWYGWQQALLVNLARLGIKLNPLRLQQGALLVDLAPLAPLTREAADAAIGGHDAMSGNGRCVGVPSHGGTHRTWASHTVAEGCGQDAVRGDASRGDAPTGGVDLLLKGCGGSIGLARRHLALSFEN